MHPAIVGLLTGLILGLAWASGGFEGLVITAALGIIASNGSLQVWHLAVGSFVNGFGWTADSGTVRGSSASDSGRSQLAVRSYGTARTWTSPTVRRKRCRALDSPSRGMAPPKFDVLAFIERSFG